ncbi:hypothetical protein [Kitasatospora phosalacinea]|uniref:Uncharacterized protein n=1 Tax=Kitasatospora phosalacinea TaxID=2065 RepID=A0ABW6GIF5_9ACTN
MSDPVHQDAPYQATSDARTVEALGRAGVTVTAPPTGPDRLLAYWLRTPDADAFRSSP